MFSAPQAPASPPAVEVKEKKARDISTIVEDCVESFSDVAVHLEKWGAARPGPPSKRPKKLQDSLKKLLKRMGRLEAVARTTERMEQQLPLGLIRHTSSGQSPNPWIAELMDIGVFENNSARGELLALASFHETLKYNLANRGKPAKAPLPPVRLQKEGLHIAKDIEKC